MGLAGYIAKRLVSTIPVIVGVTFITFFISRVVVPNPARAWAGFRATPEEVQALAARYHLNQPIYIQYFYYMEGLVTGNWGISPTSGRPVLYDVTLYFPATIELAVAAVIITVVLGIPLGVLASLHHNGKVDHSIRFLYLAGFSSPPFFVALLMLFVFGYLFHIFPTQGELSPFLTPPTHITGMYVVDSLLTGNWTDFWDALRHLVMPSVALALTYFGIVTRLTRSSMLEVLQKDFVRASYAKGLSRNTVVYRHALRNAMISTVTILGILLGSLLSGAIVIETIFSWPGIGYYATQSIENFDFPAIMGVTVLFTLSVVLANLVADVVYALLDPRIRV
jgi:ABC-type dipeptide/oligopeptide/nickel transport system permease component